MTSSDPRPESSPVARVLAIVGPTAVGKTALAVYLAESLPVEVVSADSRQIYRRLDIGTAKPTPAERVAVAHHLIDIVEPDQELTLAHYQRLAVETIEGIWRRGALPLLVGGTGLYVRAVLEGWTVPEVPPNAALRARLMRRAEREGHAALHADLARVDPVAAVRIDARNVRRVIRALEVYEATSRPISALQGSQPPPWQIVRVGLTMPREALYQRIDRRIEAMLDQGLVQEVRDLLAQGYSPSLPSMSALGYGEMTRHVRGEVSQDEAVALLKRNTRRFVRHQDNWFRRSDQSIRWFDANVECRPRIAEIVQALVLS